MPAIPFPGEQPVSGRPVLVVARDATEAAGVRRGFEDALLGVLRSRRVRALVTPHLYHLRPSHPAAALLRRAAGGLIVSTWMPPRAAFWTLRALGVERPVLQCLDLGAFASPEEAAERLLAAAGGRFRPAPALEETDGEVPPRWYPVLDASRCRNCQKCLDFCLFGVYSAEGDRVVVSSPDNCKDGCPACARTCPHGAIMFPHYFADPAIAGAEPGTHSRPPEPPTQRPRATPAGGRGDLDQLISALERLDE